MDNQLPSLTVATADKTRFGHSINLGIAVLAFGLTGNAEAPSAELKTQLLGGDYNLFDPANPPAAPAPLPSELNLGANTEQPDPLKEYLTSIKKLDKEALRAQCRTLELPEAEWGTMGKASLVTYLADKAKEEETSEETEEDDDQDQDNGGAGEGDAGANDGAPKAPADTTTGSDSGNE